MLEQSLPKKHLADTFIVTGKDAALLETDPSVPRLRLNLITLRGAIDDLVAFRARILLQKAQHRTPDA